MERHDGYKTPEQAARGDIPERYARAVATAVSPDGTTAAVLLMTNEEPAVEMYDEVCFRENGRWFSIGGTGGVGLGWHSTYQDSERNLGALRLSGKAPDGAVGTIVSFRGREHRIAVGEGGYFLFASWDEPEAVLDHDRPEPIRYVFADGSESEVPETDRFGRGLPPPPSADAPETRRRIRAAARAATGEDVAAKRRRSAHVDTADVPGGHPEAVDCGAAPSAAAAATAARSLLPRFASTAA